MSYYLRGSDGEGLGAIAVPIYEDCGFDAACIARNDAKEAAYNAATLGSNLSDHLAWCLSSSGYAPADCYAAYGAQGTIAQSANAGQPVQVTVTQPVAHPTPASASGGHVTFTSSRGSNALQVGDTWLVSITGATPNAPVTATVGSSTSSMGTTDGSGNFSLAGTARSQDVGTWNESWAVAGVPSGAFAFTVSAPSSQNGDIPTPVLPTVPVTLQTSGSAASSSTVIGGFDLSTIPTWGWLAAAGVAAFFMFGKGGR